MIIQKSLRQIYKLIIISYLLLWISIKLVLVKFIIVSDQYRRLGNRLHLFAQLIVFAKKENFELFFPGFLIISNILDILNIWRHMETITQVYQVL